MHDLAGKRVWVAGHRGMVGRAVAQRLARTAAVVITADRDRLDLRRQAEVEEWLAANQPDAVIMAAATVGGIEANRTRPAEFLYDNLAIAANVIHGAANAGVQRLMFLGSSCFYPRETEQPVGESSLLTGPLEPTNEWYAVAKIAGAKLCQAYRRQYGMDYIAAVPTNLYGPGDNFSANAGHVVPSLLRKFQQAQQSGAGSVEIWGTGRPRREFLYVEDAADAIVFLMQHYSADDLINIAGGEEVSIAELADLIAGIVGYRGELRFDPSRPDGMPRKVLDGSRLRIAGWTPITRLCDGITRTYEWMRESETCLRGV